MHFLTVPLEEDCIVLTLILIAYVLHNASQEDVYTSCGRELVIRVLDSYNGTILAYGQTGAGKTHTMTGPSSNFTLRGIIPRAIAQVHNIIYSLQYCIQWNLSIADTLGTAENVLIIEVSSFQG